MHTFWFAICDCYVWPIPYGGGQGAGRCGRCGGIARNYPGIHTHQRALEVFEENAGGLPIPIGDTPWWELPFWTTSPS